LSDIQPFSIFEKVRGIVACSDRERAKAKKEKKVRKKVAKGAAKV
jgi:hypothetical protein